MRFIEQNIECDMIWTDETNLDAYKVIFVPALYSAPKEVFERLSAFAANGGTLVATFKTGFTDEHVKVNCDRQPAGLSECMGAWYDRFYCTKKCLACLVKHLAYQRMNCRYKTLWS